MDETKQLASNFSAMPGPLRWLTALGIAVLLFPLVSLVRPVRVFGRLMRPIEFWSSGAGPVLATVTALMATSSVLMLRRSRHGRPLFVMASVAMLASAFLAAWLVGATVASPDTVLSVLFHLGTIALAGLYLGTSKAVRKYFEATDHRG